MNKKGYVDADEVLIGFLFLGVLFIVIVGGALFVDLIINEPTRSEIANQYCKDLGFDQYKYYSNKPFSNDVKGIQCEYAEKYTDLGVRINS